MMACGWSILTAAPKLELKFELKLKLRNPTLQIPQGQSMACHDPAGADAYVTQTHLSLACACACACRGSSLGSLPFVDCGVCQKRQAWKESSCVKIIPVREEKVMQ